MVDQPEVPNFDPAVYQYEVTDPVQGGLGGIANLPILNLADRTLWLKQEWDGLLNGTIRPSWIAPLNGAQFTGSDTCPNVAPGDNSTLIANTNFIQTAKSGLVVVPVGGNTNVTLTQPQWGVGIIEFTGVLTGNIAVNFPKQTGAWIILNLTTGPFTLTCQTATGGGVSIAQSQPDATIWCDGTTIRWQNTPFVIGGTGVTPGNYPFADVTVDATGRISNITSGSLGATPVTSWDGRTGAVVMNETDVVNALGYQPVGSVNGILPSAASIPDVIVLGIPRSGSFGPGGSLGSTGTTHWSVPANVSRVRMRCWGAGGGGAGSLIGQSGGGGGGGAYAEGIFSVSSVNSLTVIVGVGGNGGGAGSGSVGATGGQSSVAGFIQAGGGVGGSVVGSAPGGVGGQPLFGNILNLIGGHGAGGNAGTDGIGGTGASAPMGGPGDASSSSSPGNAAGAPGGGGAGYGGATNGSGSKGADGIILFDW